MYSTYSLCIYLIKKKKMYIYKCQYIIICTVNRIMKFILPDSINSGKKKKNLIKWILQQEPYTVGLSVDDSWWSLSLKRNTVDTQSSKAYFDLQYTKLKLKNSKYIYLHPYNSKGHLCCQKYWHLEHCARRVSG